MEDEPLSKKQQGLRGKKVVDMTLPELMDWVDACRKMEKWVKYNKARRNWKQAQQEATEELAKRQSSKRYTL